MTGNTLFALIALLGSGAAWAEGYVDKADANGDGFVSLHELRAAYFADPAFNQRIEREFASYDRNGDGLISDDERSKPAIPRQDTKPATNPKPAEPAARKPAAGNRFDSWIADIDADDSGGASMRELITSGDGQQWFSDREFRAADRNNDGDLDATELAGFMQAIERRQR